VKVLSSYFIAFRHIGHAFSIFSDLRKNNEAETH